VPDRFDLCDPADGFSIDLLTAQGVRARRLRQRRWRCVTGAAIAGDVTAGSALLGGVLVSCAPRAERRRF
jgi:hypothetical protein